MMTSNRTRTVCVLAVMMITGFVFHVAAQEQSEPDANSDGGQTPLQVASDKLTHPESTVAHARDNLSKCIDTEDEALTDLAHSLYEKCLFDKLWEPKLPGLPYRWFSISGANDSSYGKCQLQWDTMFILNAWATLDDDELMRDVFHNYWHVIDNNPEAPRGSYRYGMVPCTIKPKLPQNGYSQIPILGWGCQKVFQQTNDPELLELCLPYLDAFLHWYSTERDTDNDGLIEYGAYKKCSIADIVQTARFETFDFQATLDNLKLTKHPRRDSGGGWYGNIEGVDQTCFLLMSERAMAEMAQETGRLEMAAKYERNIAKRISAMRKKMWDPKTKFFYSLDRDSDKKIPVRTIQGFLTLTCGAASPEQAAHLVKQLKDPMQWWPEYPVTTTAMDEPTFNPKGFWRGDIWPPTNYLISLGLNRYGYYGIARELTDKMLLLVEKHDGRSFERYDGIKGIPLGVPDYCWGVTIWSMIVHNVYGVQEDYRTIVVPPHAKGRRLKLGKLELSYPSDTSLKVRTAFEREFRVIFPGQKKLIKVHCNGQSVNVLQKDVPVPEVVFVALPNKTYIVSMD